VSGVEIEVRRSVTAIILHAAKFTQVEGQLSQLLSKDFFFRLFVRRIEYSCSPYLINKIVDMSTAKKKKIYIRISLQEKNIHFKLLFRD
jgi:hypothetical protein